MFYWYFNAINRNAMELKKKSYGLHCMTDFEDVRIDELKLGLLGLRKQ